MESWGGKCRQAWETAGGREPQDCWAVGDATLSPPSHLCSRLVGFGPFSLQSNSLLFLRLTEAEALWLPSP